MKKNLKVPKFKNDEQEFEFWSKLDLSEYFEKSDFVPVTFPNLKPTSSAISLRIPKFMLGDLKERANSMDIPYQSLIKKYVADGLARDRDVESLIKRKK